ncbi:MAG: SLC45 family MFS transporter [Leptolyngbya sp. SIO4C5]|nr:SLC45 family MFS transporter [Leptolyngbya sp. SIO4C5]
MSFGFFGIQFGWGLQMANTSAIFEHLGADAHQIPILWLAAPLTGLFVQPIIGNLSDNTWGPLGRRRPYFLVGAIFSSLALIAMPNASNLWMAAGLLWILDTSANISMEPFRAFVGDLLPPEQRTKGFAMQSLFIGIGSVLASAMPWLLTHGLGVGAIAQKHAVPPAIKLSFYIGAAVFLSTVLWTVFTTEEYPPKDMTAFKAQQERRLGIGSTFREIGTALKQMPPTMRQLAWVQCFSWLGMYCMFLYFPPAIARNILGAVDEASPLYAEGIEWAGLCIAMYNAVCFAFSLVLPKIAAATSRKTTHALCLVCGAAGLISLNFIHNQYLVLLSMVGVGIAWASMLAMPYAMLVGALPPKKSGIYMGIFNFFIVLPEIVASLVLGWVMIQFLHDNRLTAVVLGGVFMLIAALLTQRVQEAAKAQPTTAAAQLSASETAAAVPLTLETQMTDSSAQAVPETESVTETR